MNIMNEALLQRPSGLSDSGLYFQFDAAALGQLPQACSKLASGVYIPILYEDNHLFVVLKPVGLPVQEDRRGKPDLLNLLKDDLARRGHKSGEAWLGLVHRLDQPVSGIMVFAKTSKAASRLSQAFRQREVEKIYHAVVRGQVKEERGEWLDRISNKKVQGRYQLSPEGKASSLEFERVKLCSTPPMTLLRITLGSGRSHQIRVQTSSRGFPLAGDRRYGLMDDFDRKLPAPALIATELSFLHPVQKRLMHFQLSLPNESPWNFFLS